MNIWAWVRRTRQRLLEGGDARAERLRELMNTLPNAVVNEAHARVDAIVPEALALARELDEPWVEVFIRHWDLQSRVLHRRRAGEELREAVELLDFANRERTRECPQAVCTVQDLAVCYAIRDGPGYVPERLAVARETLARIDPSWGCFDCINGEYVSALFDDQRPEEALAWIDAQDARAAEHGEFEPGFNTLLNRARALRALGRGREALAILDGVRNVERFGSARVMGWRQARVATLLCCGDVAAALELHPPAEAIIQTGSHLRGWVDNTLGLIEAGAVANTSSMGRSLHAITLRFVDGHAYWDTARTALIGARLALARGARTTARLCVDDAGPARAKLRRPERLASLVAEVEAGLTVLDQRPDGDRAEDELERRLDRLWSVPAATRTLAQSIELAGVLRELGRAAASRSVLDARVDQGQGLDAVLRVELAATMLAGQEHGGLDRLCGGLAPLEPELAWIYGQSLIERGALRRALELDRSTLAELGPDSEDRGPVRERLAETARALGDWAAYLDVLDGFDRPDEGGRVDWRRLMAATILGDRARVEQLEEQLGLDEAERGRYLRCQFLGEAGPQPLHWAVSTSACSARIVEIALPTQVQHFRDHVVFEPPEACLEARAPGRRGARRVVATLERGGYRSYLIRGFDPGEAVVEALGTTVAEHGWGFERLTSPGRERPDPRMPGDGESEVMVPTMAVLIALPERDEGHALAAVLDQRNADWPLPLLCPELDARRGDAQSARSAAAMLDRWRP